MAKRLLGVETEYAFSVFGVPDPEAGRHAYLRRLMALAGRKLTSLPGRSNGLFLANGSRFYVDHGGHPELCTPECTSPEELVRYLLAGDRILAELARGLGRPRSGATAHVFKTNVDYSGTSATWGSHENYLHRADPAVLARELLPHLVSRLIYTGAGGFDNLHPGLRFVVSPRVPHLRHPVSSDSTGNRGIVHTKNESLCRGRRHRLHLLCGESLCSERASYLRVGATALVVALVEAGVQPGRGVALASPLEAMQAFAADPALGATVPLAGGRGRISAEGIQRHYLARAEEHLDARGLPAWAGPVLEAWRAVLDELSSGGAALDRVLDWRIKRVLVLDHVRRRGLTPETIDRWNRALDKAQRLSPIRASLAALPPAARQRFGALRGGRDEKRLALALDEEGLDRAGLEPFLALRRELFEVDTRFGELGDDGLFARLDRAGVLRHRIENLGDVEAAVLHPPPATRAALRGRTIRALASRRQTAICDWNGIWQPGAHRMLDLSDPFARTERWRPLPPRRPRT